MAKLDFHLVSENGNVKVFQAMEAAKTSDLPDGSQIKKYTPYLPKKPLEVDVSDYFAGYDVEAVKVSRDAGVIVRVKRAKDDVLEDVEPNVVRLETTKGGAK